MKERKEIDIAGITMDAILLLAEGNPGAVGVLARLVKGEEGASFVDALHLDDMNIRGTQIWIAFKDFAKEDLAVFVKAIRERNAEMIRVVNDEGFAGNHSWRAISGGASEGRRSRLAAGGGSVSVLRRRVSKSEER